MYSDRNRSRYGNTSVYGSSSSSSSSSAARILLPAGMGPGAIIGKGGSNIKMLQSRSGARLTVNTSSNCVEVSGSAAAVDAAKRMVQKQIQAYLATGGAYLHPQLVNYLLDPSFGAHGSNLVTFQACNGEVALATGRREQLFVLAPTSGGGGYPTQGQAGNPSSFDYLADIMGGLSMAGAPAGAAEASHRRSSSTTPTFLLPSQQRLLQDGAATAAQKAVQHTPRFDEIKLRFNFGKNFFYNGPSRHTSWTLQQLQDKSVPNDMKSAFSNTVSKAAWDMLRSWLLQQGFTHVQNKSTVSVHIKHQETSTGYTIAFINNSGSLTLRKHKSGNNKLAFGTLLCSPESPDWRYKMLAQYHFNADPSTKALLNSLASSARLSHNGVLSIPGLAAADMINDKERHKEKSIFVGRWPGSSSNGGYGGYSGSSGGSSGSSSIEIKVTLSKVFDALTGRHCYEMAGTSPEINALLQQQLGRGSMGSTEEQQLLQHLDSVVGFSRAAAACMA